MSIEAVHRQYNDIVAPHYDRDPQGLIHLSLDRALEHLRNHHLVDDGCERLRVLDVGMGTGLFLAKLKAVGGEQIVPFGLDLAEKMVDLARERIPDLTAEVDDAANLDACFPDQSFDLVCTHFVTGFVSMNVLAPQIARRLELGGAWSLLGGTRAGFPMLQARANVRGLRWLTGAGAQSLHDGLQNPADLADAVATMEAHGFEVCAAETLEPQVQFADFEQFMEFAYHGGWLTAVIERLGLHEAKAPTRWLLNRLVFPFKDHHRIAAVLARKVRS
jgi:SAM-dependent methyltransferase